LNVSVLTDPQARHAANARSAESITRSARCGVPDQQMLRPFVQAFWGRKPSAHGRRALREFGRTAQDPQHVAE